MLGSDLYPTDVQVEEIKSYLVIGGLERDAEGFKSAVRVRMMHVPVRAMLLQSGKWKMEWGQALANVPLQLAEPN